MSKIVLEGVPEADYDDRMRALILEVNESEAEGNPNPRVFVRIQSWEDIGNESSPDSDLWHPRLRALKEAAGNNRGNRMKYLIASAILVLACLATPATAGRYVVEEKFVPEGSCVMYDVDNGDMRKCTDIEDLKYRVEFSCLTRWPGQ